MLVFVPLYLGGQPKVWTAFWVPDAQYMRQVLTYGDYKHSRTSSQDIAVHIGNVTQPTTDSVMSLPHLRRRVEQAGRNHEGEKL